MNTMAEPTEVLVQMTGKTAEGFALWADINQKVLRELVDFSASAAKEGVRLFAELQSAAVEAVKDGQSSVLRRPSWVQDVPRVPFESFHKAVLESAEGTFKLLEGNAKAVTRSVERLQVATEQTSRSIQDSFAEFTGQLKRLYSLA
jgi:hypothetical protein